MEGNSTPRRIHPLMAAASVSVILVSLVGVAAMTGLLPTSHGEANKDQVVASAPTPSPAVPAATPLVAPGASAGPEQKVAREEESRPVHKVAKPLHRSTQVASVEHERVPAPRPEPAAPQYGQAASNYPTPVQAMPATPPLAQAPVCHDCGKIESIEAVQTAAKPSGLGVIAGGVIGGLLGNQVGGGNGRTLATVAGAVAGGYGGNEVEKRTRSTTAYRVHVRMEDGSYRTIPQTSAEGWHVGQHVRIINGALAAEG